MNWMTTAKRRMSKRGREIMPSPRVTKPVNREGNHAQPMSSNESTPKKSKISSDILLLGRRRQDAAELSVQHHLIDKPQADGPQNASFNEVNACFLLDLT